MTQPPGVTEGHRGRGPGWVRLASLTLAVAAAAPIARAGDAGDADAGFFTGKVEPILRQRCYSCHSHAAGKMKGGLSLDWKSGWAKGGQGGPALVPGKPDESPLIEAVRRQGSEMPPDEALPEAEVATLVEWVRRGAPDPRVTAEPRSPAPADWWSLRPLRPPAVPAVPPEDARWARNPIDAFVAATLRTKGLAPGPEADRRTLIRRLYFDLLGLAPTPEEADAFAADPDPNAYDALVDRLLAAPGYGERWARHWLDTIHFADTHGCEHDGLRPNAWRYRDYVVDSLNRDTPWARFIREQIAVDRLYPAESHLTPALGFLGAGTLDLSTLAVEPAVFEYLDRDDLVTQTMAAFCGATINCARCHDHKFDPFPQADYYALQAVFAGLNKGDIAFDPDDAVAARRKAWHDLIAAADRRDPAALLSAENEPLVRAWEEHRASHPAAWTPLEPEVFYATRGSTLKRGPDASVVASEKHPDLEAYVITSAPAPGPVTAIRLEVLNNPALPQDGPGRAGNGNLHVSEVEAIAFKAGAPQGTPLKFRRATADFEQAGGYTVATAIDGKDETSWAIFPAVGRPHHAVFELEAPVTFEAGARVALTLKQLQPGHLIGAFRLSVTGAPAADAAALPEPVAAALATPRERRTDEQKLALAAHACRARATEELGKLPPQAHVFGAASLAAPGGKPRPPMTAPKVVHVLARGDFHQPGAVAEPGALSALGDLTGRFPQANPADEGARRAALADWIADGRNPLTWRTVVNRVWQDHLGRGLCDSPGDLGRMGGVPSHPELLDWLAANFRDAGGTLKPLHRLIVTSATYRQSSAHRADAAAIDADDRLLWRAPRRRLDAEAYRDIVLQAAGRLDRTPGGPGVKHYGSKPGPQVTPVLTYEGFDWDAPGAGRRSVYRFVYRTLADPFMEALDFPDLSLLTPTRGASSSALQALTLFNDDFVLRQSEHLAARAGLAGPDPDAQVRRAFRLVMLRDPAADERQALASFAGQHGLAAACRLLLNSNEFLFVD